MCEGELVIPDAREFAERVVGEVHARIALAFGRRFGEALGECMGWNAERLLETAGVDFLRAELNGLPVEEQGGNNRESGGNYAI
jgi:hypothetical protein